MSISNDTKTPDINNDALDAQDALAGMTLNDRLGNIPVVVLSIKSKLEKAKEKTDDPAERKCIDALPAEITEQIVAFTQAETGEPWPLNPEYPLLKTMRLVSPAFNQVASQYLFNTVVLYEHPDRYAALNSIAKTPYLAPLVELVQLANLGFLPDCAYQGNYWNEDGEEKDESHECRTSRNCGSFNFWQSITSAPGSHYSTITPHPPAGGPLAKLDFSPKATYARYVTWRDGERAMKDHVKNGTAPRLDLRQLPNLHNVEAVGLKEMRVIKRQPEIRDNGWDEYMWTQMPETRRFYETGLIEVNAMNRIRYATLTHLPTFMIAASVCGKDLTSLTVHRLDELFKGEEHDHSNLHIRFRSLRCLKIDLREVWYSYSSMNDPDALAPWLHDSESLEELHISQNPQAVDEQVDVLQLFQELKLPKLAVVDLKDGIVNFRVLGLLLSRHKETLRLLKSRRRSWSRIDGMRFVTGMELDHVMLRTRRYAFLSWHGNRLSSHGA